MKFSFKNVNDDPSMSEYPLPGCYRPNVFNPGYIQNPYNIRKQILQDLELEKKKIREQLLVVSNAHKLVMEAGLRIEFLLDRQMAIVRDDHFPSISPGSQVTRYDNRLSNVLPCGVTSVKDRLGPPQGIRKNVNLHPTRCLEPNLVEIISNSEISNDIISAESPELFCGAKCAAEKPLPKERNCAICKLNFSNAQKLNDHIHGRDHNAAFRRFFKIEKSSGDHESEQNADVSMMDIDDSKKENGNSEVQLVKLTNSNNKLLSLFKGSDYENMMNDCRSRGKNSGEFVEVAQDGGICEDKISTDEKETNKASAETGMPYDVDNSEQNNCDSGKKSGNLSANLVKTGDGNASDSIAHHNDSPLQKNISGAKRKAEKQPLETVGASKIPSAISTKTILKEKAQEGRKEAAEIRKTLVEEMRHKAAQRRENFGTVLVPKDSNKRVKIAENRNSEQVIQNTEFKKLSSEKNEAAEAVTLIIKDSMRENGNPEVQTQKIVYSNKELWALSISQNGGFQVGNVKVEQKMPKISASKDKEIHKLKEAKPVGYVSGLKHKAETQPLEEVGPSNVSLAGAKKKPKQEFRCELCQVFVSTERNFNGHIQGKRHKAAERRGNLVIGSVLKDNNNNIKLSVIPKNMGLANNSLAINSNNNLSLSLMTLESSNSSLASNNKVSLDPKNFQLANNSLGKIAENHNNSKLARLNALGEVIPPKINQTSPESIQNNKVTPCVDEMKQETKDKNDLPIQVTLDTVDGNGISTDTVLNVGDGNGYESIACKNRVGAFTKKGMNDHKNEKRHLDKLLEVAKNDKSQAEDVCNNKKETMGISLNISGAQENRNLEQNADEPKQETKIESESQLIRNTTCKSEKEAENLTKNTSETGNGSKKFKFVCTICKVGHNTERVMIAHKRKPSHLEQLRQLAENREPVCVEKAANGVPENERETKQRCEDRFSEKP